MGKPFDEFRTYVEKVAKEFPEESESLLVLYLCCSQEIDDGAPVDETIYEYIAEIEGIIKELRNE
jgi:hypothetical protein